MFLILIFYFSMSTLDTTPVPAEPPRDFHFKYTVQKGFFLQSEDSTDDKKFDYVCNRRHHMYLTDSMLENQQLRID